MKYSWPMCCYIRESMGIRIARGILSRPKDKPIEALSPIFHPYGMCDYFKWVETKEGHEYWRAERDNKFCQMASLRPIQSLMEGFRFAQNRPYLELYFL